jgi:hypothetical protein
MVVIVSRVDTLVDRLLADRIEAIGDSVERQKLRALGAKRRLPMLASPTRRSQDIIACRNRC